MKIDKFTFREYAEKMIEVFGYNAKIGLCFLVAATFQDIIRKEAGFFPILYLNGPKGTGKTEMARALTSFFTVSRKKLNINYVPGEKLAEALSDKSNVLVHIDDYRNNIDGYKEEVLKSIWDGTTSCTKATSNVAVMSGQEIPDFNSALYNRLVVLRFQRTSFTKYDDIKLRELWNFCVESLTRLSGQMLSNKEYFRAHFSENWIFSIEDLNKGHQTTSDIQNRIVENWSVLLASFRCLEDRIDFPMTYKEILEICLDGCGDQILPVWI